MGEALVRAHDPALPNLVHAAQGANPSRIRGFRLERGGGADPMVRMTAKTACGNYAVYNFNKSETTDTQTEATHPSVPVKWIRHRLDPMRSR